MSDDFDNWLDNEDDSDEQSDEGGTPQAPEGFGFTGELPWMQDDDEGESADDADMPEWMRESAEAAGSDEDTSDLPPWLQDAAASDETERSVVDETGGLAEDFLAQGESLVETGTSDLTYDEWAAIQAEASRERDPEEYIPDDLFDDMATDADAETGTGALPEWYLGLDELSDEDAPEWLEQVGVPGGTTDSGMLGDVLAGGGETPADAPDDAEELPSFDDLAGFGFDDQGGEDFFAATDEPPSPELDDFFSSLGDDQPDEGEGVTRVETGEFLSQLGLEGDDVPGDVEDEAMSRVDTGDFLSDLGLEAIDESADAFEHVDTDDFLDDLGLEASDQPAAEYSGPPIKGTSDFLGELGLTDEEQAEAAEDLASAFTEAIPGAGDINTGELLDSLGLEIDELPEDAQPVAEAQRFEADQLLDELGFDDDLGIDDVQDDMAVEEQVVVNEFFDDSGEPDDSDFDWFAETEAPVGGTDALDWLDQIDSADYDPTPQDEDADVPVSAAETQADIDALIESMGEDVALPQSGMLAPGGDDLAFDDFFSDPAFSEIDTGSLGIDDDDEQMAGLDMLAELGVNVDDISATSIIRQQSDRDVGELDDRLMRLHERSEDFEPQAADVVPDSAGASKLFAGIDDVLHAADISTERTDVESSLTLSTDQQQRVDLLRTLGGTDTTTRTGESAIDATYADDFDDVEMSAEDRTEDVRGRKVTRFTGVRWERIVIGIILAVVVVLPFVIDDVDVGDLPPFAFEAGSTQRTVFDRINTLGANDTILIAAEYGPTGAGELDDLTKVISQHIFMRGARPVYVSTNPVGLLHVNNVVFEITDDEIYNQAVLGGRGLTQNLDYYVSRYLAGSAIGLRAFGEDLSAGLETDIRGDALLLDVNSLDDFALIIIVAERAEDVRNWAEQIVPLTNTTVFAVTSAAAAPLTEPFVVINGERRIQGMLVGFRDAYTYSAMLDTLLGPDAQFVPPSTRIPPTMTPTPAPPTATPTITSTPLPPTPIPVITGVINSAQAVNVRQTPSTNSPVVDVAQPGDPVTVLGQTDDGEWIHVITANGIDGWISAALLTVQGDIPLVDIGAEVQMTLTSAAATSKAADDALTATADALAASDTPQASNTPAASNTPRPSNTPTTQATIDPVGPTLTAVAVTNTAIAEINAATATALVGQSSSAGVAVGRISANQTVNIRNGPSTNFPVVDLASVGTILQILGQNAGGTWLNVVTPNNIEGWVSTSLVEIDGNAELPVIESQSSAPPPVRFARALPANVSKLQPTTVPLEVTLTQIAATNQAVGESLTATIGAAGVDIPTMDVNIDIPELGDAEATLTAVAVTNTAIADFIAATANAAQPEIVTPTPVDDDGITATETKPVAVEESQTDTPSPTPTDTPTPLGPTTTPIPEIEPSLSSFSNERWNAITLGIIAATAIIALGAFINIIRGILRRSRS